MNFNLNGLNVYKPLFHLDLMVIFTMKEIFLKCRISMLFFLLDIKKRNKQSDGKSKNGNFKRKHKIVLSLFDLNILLHSGRKQMLSKLASLSISSLRKLADEANKLYDRKHDLYEAALHTRFILNMLFVVTWILKLTTLDTSSKFHSLIKVMNSWINKAYFEIIMLYQLYLHISKTRNHLLYVTDITNLSVILYFISTSSFWSWYWN